MWTVGTAAVLHAHLPPAFSLVSCRVNNLFSPLQVFKDIAFVIFKCQLEGQCRMVALQHSSVVVQHGQFVSRVAEEGVGSPRVIHIVDGGSNEGSNLVNAI